MYHIGWVVVGRVIWYVSKHIYPSDAYLLFYDVSLQVALVKVTFFNYI